MGESVYCYPHDAGLHELRVLMMEANDTDFTAAENWKKMKQLFGRNQPNYSKRG